jgi:hypothetical protein
MRANKSYRRTMICAYMTLKETSQAAELTEVASEEIPDRVARGL